MGITIQEYRERKSQKHKVLKVDQGDGVMYLSDELSEGSDNDHKENEGEEQEEIKERKGVEKQQVKKVCGNCGSQMEGMKLCSRCNKVYYCNRDC